MESWKLPPNLVLAMSRKLGTGFERRTWSLYWRRGEGRKNEPIESNKYEIIYINILWSMVIYHHFVFHYGAKFRDKSAMFGSESASTHEEEKNIICKPTITVRCITTSQIQSHYRVRECRLWSFALMITCKLHSQHKTFTYLYQNWIFVWDREIRLFYADLY